MASAPRSVLVLGSTGSIGRQALEVISATPGMSVAGLAAHADVDGLLQQAAHVGVRLLALGDERRAAEARERLGSLPGGRSPHKTLGDARVFVGDEGVEELIAAAAAEAQAGGAELIVLNAVVGAAGLRATMATLRRGVTLALANKESLVAGGPFVLEAARRGRRADPPGRQRAQRHLPAPRGRAAPGDRGDPAHGLRRAVPRPLARRAARRDGRRRAAPPDVGHGSQDHHRLGHVDEQGPRGDRGALPLRRAL